MAKQRLFLKGEESLAPYYKRTGSREKTLMSSTMSLVAYFMGLGDSKIEAENKVTQISTELAPYLYAFTLGNTQLLVNKVNEIDEIVMPFMDTLAKNFVIGELGGTV